MPYALRLVLIASCPLVTPVALCSLRSAGYLTSPREAFNRTCWDYIARGECSGKGIRCQNEDNCGGQVRRYSC